MNRAVNGRAFPQRMQLGGAGRVLASGAPEHGPTH